MARAAAASKAPPARPEPASRCELRGKRLRPIALTVILRTVFVKKTDKIAPALVRTVGLDHLRDSARPIIVQAQFLGPSYTATYRPRHDSEVSNSRHRLHGGAGSLRFGVFFRSRSPGNECKLTGSHARDAVGDPFES
jgi:hypothetical protein